MSGDVGRDHENETFTVRTNERIHSYSIQNSDLYNYFLLSQSELLDEQEKDHFCKQIKETKFIEKFVSSCDACQKRKHSTVKSHSIFGELYVPDVPFLPFLEILMGPLNRTAT